MGARILAVVSKREILVEWGHCDPAGIVFNPRFFEWFDAATAGLFAQVGLPKPKLIERFGIIGIPLVETQAKFILPSRFGDTITIESAIASFGRSSFEVEHKLFNGGALATEGRETRVWTGRHPENSSRMKSKPIPEEVIALFRGE
ncbi:MAG: acyl-CoA thioesterase [Hyphomicrobiales bacterium]|nr:acyl-CoA thioesterase [Hyphomicrobiales bacterium]MBV9054719.1 acyl-CoA thioesterase [Hyphomicrobiales bacterium]MBV9590051.1 acyl-CoA thioesterase [Hyphomicrobiales bacterium]MBV9974994.1 acyl-CoA thioesterase [Hyphomicrobiales bacterium]